MPTTNWSFFAAAGVGLASLALACGNDKPPSNQEVRKLVELSRESNAALLRGDAERYFTLVSMPEDFTLMSPFGGAPSHGAYPRERREQIGKFFKDGSLEQELVQAYGTRDMIVLATIERAHVQVGELPAQDWALRVTLVYRREGSEWRLVHRHADPLANAISVSQSAALARGERAGGG
jgi:ketosteroid isomerase-like protein